MRLRVVFCLVLLTAACRTSRPQVTYLLDTPALPGYERSIDHAGLIGDLDKDAVERGMVTYRNTCYSCHGDPEQPGSLPTARRFWDERFKNGADPYALYQTLTRGFGLMPPQVRLTPREKYDVIQFIREEFLKKRNLAEYVPVTEAYLARLPAGDTRGPEPQPYRPWAEMDYGDFLIHTYELANSTDPPRRISGGPSPLANEDLRDANFAYKGIAIRLDEGEGGVAAGSAFVLFDHDLMRMTGIWTGAGFIDYESILLNDRHNIFPRTVGTIQVENPITPGWANPATGDFADPRFVAVDGRPFGPLPREWTHYTGLYRHGRRVVIAYTVGDADVLESYDLQKVGDATVVGRTLNIGAARTPLTMRIAPETAAVHVAGQGATLAKEAGFHVLKVPAATPAVVTIRIAPAGVDVAAAARAGDLPADLRQYTRGGPARDTAVLTAPIVRGQDRDAYAVDVLTLPLDNPWKSRLRPSGIDFLPGGDEAVVTTVDGEVWRLEGITQPHGIVQWRRIATGLFQPLGVKYHNGSIYVGCRDQIVVLRDLDGDGATDFYESFNSDHQVTEHFHEFAMGLQTDPAGNFYYAKSARHARTALIPQHGTLIRVSPDGRASEIVATGFRAANGVLLNPDGSFIVTDQEGYWTPMNRINWVERGGFYGNMYGYGAPADSSDAAMIKPLLWIDSKHDRSPAELLWADSGRFGPLDGSLLSLSYGDGRIFVVMPQTFAGTRQGAIVALPLPRFPTGIIRGRFNPKDGQLYVLGLSAWATHGQAVAAAGGDEGAHLGDRVDVRVADRQGGREAGVVHRDRVGPRAGKDVRIEAPQPAHAARRWRDARRRRPHRTAADPGSGADVGRGSELPTAGPGGTGLRRCGPGHDPRARGHPVASRHRQQHRREVIRTRSHA
jgi:glucose/arabinose dehydrogenase